MDRSKAIKSVLVVGVVPVVVGIITNLGTAVFQWFLPGPDSPPAATKVAPELATAAVEQAPEFRKALDHLRNLPAIHLFNKRDLTGLTTFIGPKEPGGKPVGKDRDPDSFRVQDGFLDITCKQMAELSTVASYANYLLTVEYRWGPKPAGVPSAKPRRAAVNFHAFGPNGAILGIWAQGYRVALHEGSAGNLGLPMHDSPEPILTVEAEAFVDRSATDERITHSFKPGGQPYTVIPGGSSAGRARMEHTEGIASTALPEIEFSQGWNTLELLCAGDSVGVILNGHLVNAARASRHAGKIQIHTLQSELLVRTIDLRKVGPDDPVLPGMPAPSPGSWSTPVPTSEEKPVQGKHGSASAKKGKPSSSAASPDESKKSSRRPKSAAKP